jgi:uncharacterized OB-fold protein
VKNLIAFVIRFFFYQKKGIDMSDIKEGWKCPVCKKVFAPTQKMCKKCSKVESTNNPEDSKIFLQD